MVKRIVALARRNRQDVRAERAKVGPLKKTLVTERTEKRHAHAFLLFTTVCALSVERSEVHEDVDGAAYEFMEYL